MSRKARAKRVFFTDSNCHALIDIVWQYKDIIECKKTDAVTWKEKDAAWVKIAEAYNSATTEPKTIEQLRGKYDNLKREVRKYEALRRQNLYQTGGGVEGIDIKEVVRLLYAKIKSIITLSVQGLEPGRGDSDEITMKSSDENDAGLLPCASTSKDSTVMVPSASPTNNTGNQYVENGQSYDTPQSVDEESKKDWSDYNPNMLKSKKHRVLQRKRKIREQDTDCLDLKNDNLILKNKLLEEEAIRNKEFHIERIRRDNELHALKIKNLELENKKLELEIEILKTKKHEVCHL